ncbi:MAG TPA: FAD-dependent oxidoreductase [Chloroflexota bacterium]|nr:FAD-dependent oxidoreductase [Chloroflexota bacterium]
MRAETYDLVVVGGGSAGLVAARAAAALGARVALLDRERLGGECLWTGCVPSKALIAGAAAAHQARNLGALGLSGWLEPVDLGTVMDRVHGVIQTVYQGEDAAAMRKHGITVRFGEVRFRSSHMVTVDDQPLRGRAFLLCTGSSPAVPDIDGLQGSGYLTNETIFSLRELPAHLIVAGGGPVGVELAQAFRRLGSAVTVLAGERGLLPREDDEVRKAVGDLFRREGIAVRRSKLVGVGRGNAGVEVRYAGEGGEGSLQGDRLLLALGRRPNVAGLGLEQAGVRYDAKQGITIDPYLRTSVPHILACGDVTGPYRFTHAAGFQAAAAVRNALFPRLKSTVKLDPMPWTTFTDPEVARVGLTEAEARRAHGKVLVLRAEFAHTDRAQAEGQTEGFVKLIVSPWRGTILGGHIVGPRAGELIQEVTLAMRRGLDVRALADTIHVYPTLSMAVQQAALDFYPQWPLYRLARRPLRAFVRRVRG